MNDSPNGKRMALQTTKEEPEDPAIIYLTPKILHESTGTVPTTVSRTIITTNLNGYIFESDIKIEESVLLDLEQPQLIELLQDITAADDNIESCQREAVVRVKKLSDELMAHYSRKETVFECYVCGYTTSVQRRLRKHLLNHSMTKPSTSYTDVGCLRKVSVKVRKLSAEQMAQLSQKTILFECYICGHQTTGKGHLRTHLMNHKDNKPFPCRTCNKVFCNRFYLKVHEVKHTGERKYPCELCPMKFLYRSNLRSHLETHSEERSFRCLICKKRIQEGRRFEKSSSYPYGRTPLCLRLR